MKLVPAPSNERAAIVAAARARFGKATRVELTHTGDRVEHVERASGPAAPARPRSEGDVVQLAHAFWRDNADLFGLDGKDLAKLEIRASFGQGQWHADARGFARDPIDGPIARGGSAITVNLRLAPDGGMRDALVTDDAWPAVTACSATLDRAEIERAVDGASLEWDSETGHLVEGKADRAHIKSIARTLARVDRTYAPEADLELQVVYEVVVALATDDFKTWTLEVDPVAAKVVDSFANFMD